MPVPDKYAFILLLKVNWLNWLENVRKQLFKYNKTRKCCIICCRTQCLHRVAKMRREAERKKHKQFKGMRYYTRVKWRAWT